MCSAPAAMRSPRSSSTTRVILGSSSVRAWAIECHSRSDSSPSAIVDLVDDGVGRHAEEARVEPARPAGRRDGAREERQPRQRRPEAGGEELLPGRALAGLRGAARACRSAGPPPRRSRARRPAPAPAPCATLGVPFMATISFLRSPRLEVLLDRDLPVGGIDAAAGKHVAARHEHHVEAPPPEQHARLARGIVDDDQRRGIARAQRARLGGAAALCCRRLLRRSCGALIRAWRAAATI